MRALLVALLALPSVAPAQSAVWPAPQPTTGTVGVTGIDSPVTTLSGKLAAAPLTTVVEVGDTATALPATPLASRTSVCVFNNGDAPLYLGTAGVTAATGFPLLPQTSFCDDVGVQQLFAVAASGTVEARVLED